MSENVSKYYVYYLDRGKELVYTWFKTPEEAFRASKIISGYVK